MLSRDSLGESIGSEEKEKKEAKDSLDMRDDNMIRGELQWRSSKILEECSVKSILHNAT